MTVARPIAAIVGVGAAAPERVVTNADLERTLDTSDAWITERTGIRQRHIAGQFETLTSYSLKAAQQALAMAGLTASDLDGIVFATVSPDHRLPSAACDLQAALGIEGSWAVDVVAACPGWVYGLTVAEGLMATGHGDTILVVGAEKLSSITDPQDRGTAILFGDGAGAGILRRVDGATAVFSLRTSAPMAALRNCCTSQGAVPPIRSPRSWCARSGTSSAWPAARSSRRRCWQ